MGAPTATHWWSRWWSKVKGLAFGAGFRDNVLDAYRYLMEVYNDNGGNGNEDEVYIFGFSREAYRLGRSPDFYMAMDCCAGETKDTFRMRGACM